MNMSFRPSALLTWFLSFSFLGALLVSLVGPTSISWYFQPPVDIGLNCSPAVDWAMKTLIKSQLIGAGIGIVLGGIIFFVLLKKDKSKNPVV